MSTPRRFVEAFLREKAEAFAEVNVRLSLLHAKYFGTPLLERSGSLLMRDPLKGVIEHMKESTDFAIATVRERAPGNAFICERYHLSKDGESWRIIRIDRECFLCRGTGRFEGVACPKCDGEGWNEIGAH